MDLWRQTNRGQNTERSWDSWLHVSRVCIGWRFLIKGDVFGFGLVVLGTLWHGGCGKRKRYCMDRELLCETCDAKEFVRCVNGGLLCVQEHPWDRPTLSNIVLMLGSETASLLTPKQQDLQ